MAFISPLPSVYTPAVAPLSSMARRRTLVPLAPRGATLPSPTPMPARAPTWTTSTCGRRNGRSSSSSGRGRPPSTPRFGEAPAAGGQRRRPVRVGELLKRELSGIIPSLFARDYEREDARAAGASSVLISIMDVRVSDDLRSARVKVSVLGDPEVRATAMGWLKSARRTIRHEVARELRGMKTVPELVFDESFIGDAFATVSVIDRLAEERTEREAAGGGHAAVGGLKSTFTLADVDGLTDEEVEALEGLDGLDALDDDDDEDAIIGEDEDEDEVEEKVGNAWNDDDDAPRIVDVGGEGEDEVPAPARKAAPTRQ